MDRPGREFLQAVKEGLRRSLPFYGFAFAGGTIAYAIARWQGWIDGLTYGELIIASCVIAYCAYLLSGLLGRDDP